MGSPLENLQIEASKYSKILSVMETFFKPCQNHSILTKVEAAKRLRESRDWHLRTLMEEKPLAGAEGQQNSQPDPKGDLKAEPSLKSDQKKELKKQRWQSLQSHLDEALTQWNELSTQMQGELSPDEKRLNEVKQLLNQLKVKLEEF
jgi:hypothetical protein